MEWLEVAASSVDDAKEEALDRLGVHESDAEFEILTEERIGLFGRVKQEARVRARIKPVPVRPKRVSGRRRRRSRPSTRRSGAQQGSRPNRSGQQDSRSDGSGQQVSRSDRSKQSQRQGPATSSAPQAGGAPKKGNAPRAVNRKQNAKGNPGKDKDKMQSHSAGLSLDEQAELAEAFVQGIGETVGISLTFIRHEVENNVMRIEAKGDNLGILVGRRGLTAQAIDDLVRIFLQKSGGTTKQGKIRMDIGGVLARRTAAFAEFKRQESVEPAGSGSSQ